MIYNLTSVFTIVLKVIRDAGLSDTEVRSDDFIEWIADGLKHIGSYYQFTPKAKEIRIEDFKGELPCDFYKPIRILIGTNHHDYQLPHNNPNLIHPTQEEEVEAQHTPGMRGEFFTRHDYKITHNVITIAHRTGVVHLQYLAFPIDEEGLPLVPDDVSVSDALYWKVVYHLCMSGHTFKQVKLNDLDFTKRKWDFYCMQARANSNMPDLEMQERLKNMFLTLKTNQSHYRRLFHNLGNEEFLNLGGKY